MALANTNRAKLAMILEEAFGVTPTTGNGKFLRFTGESLNYGIKTEASKEIRDDRMLSDLAQVGADSTGGFNLELSYREYDALLEAALMGTWTEYGTNGVGTSFTAEIDSAAGTITADVAPTGTSAFTDLAVGQWVRVTAPTDAADGAFVKIAARTGTVITVDTETPIPGTGTRAAVANVKLSSSRLVNGVTERSFTIERSFQDIGQYWAFRGQTVGKFSLELKSGSIVTGMFDFMGKNAKRGTASVLPGTTAASQEYDVMNAVSGSNGVYESGALMAGTFAKTLKFDLDNRLRGRDGIGTLGNVGIGVGTLGITGTFDVYLNDGSLYDKFVDNEATSLSWYVRDGAKNGYVFTFPRVKFSDAKVNAGGQDQDAMLSIPFTALRDPATNAEVIIDRLGA